MTERIVKLSPLQKELYEAMLKGVTCRWMPHSRRFGGAYFYRSDIGKRCTKQVEALLRAGLVERFEQNPHNSGHRVRVKPAITGKTSHEPGPAVQSDLSSQ